MDPNPPVEDLIVRYLLGELPEEEQARLEDQAFADPQYAQEILAVEGDLIDEYVRGGLSAARRQRFETLFFASAERRKKVEFARALARVTAGGSEADERSGVTWWEAIRAFMGGLIPVPRLALAAGALVLLVVSSLLLVERGRLREQIAQFQAGQLAQQRQEDELRREGAAARAHSEELATALEREQQRVAEPVRQTEGGPTQGGSARQPLILSLFLQPGISRSAVRRPQIVVPPPTVPLARLQVGLEREDDFARFQVEIKTLTGQRVWFQDDLRPEESRAGRVITLTIPASALGAGAYELNLKGVADSRTAEDVRFYYFDVVKK